MLKALFARPGERPAPVESEADIVRHVNERQGCLWVDLEGPTEAERGILSRVFKFHDLAITNSLEKANHPRIDDYGDYLYVVFHGVVAATKGASRFELQELDTFIGEHFLVTFHEGPEKSIDYLRERCRQFENAMGRGPDRLLAEILDHVADEYVTVMERLDQEIDVMEDRLFKSAGRPALREIFSLKKDVLHLRRVVNPQREVLNRLARSEHKVISKEETIFFRDVYDHIYRVSEMLESFRDVLSGAMEVYLTIVSNRINEVMRVLTVFSIVLMSTSFVAGLWGMNVPVPGEGKAGAFYFLLLGMAGITGVLLVAFRKRKWI